MNKVIWSEARNAYVVVSEMAKSHGTKSCSTKKLLAMLIATGVMTCASMAPAMAGNPAPNDTKIEVGKGASAVEKSVAIGNDASVVAGSNGSGGVALGNKAHAGYKGTSLGSSAISGREGATLVGANTNSASLYTTVIGTDSVINSDGTSYKVKIDILFGTYEKDVNIQGATATLVGTSNKVDNKNKLVYSGVANNVMGAANTIEASNGVTIQGSGNTVTDAYKDMNISTSEGLKVLLGDYSVLAGKESGAVAVIGGANTVSKQTDSTVIGYENQLAGGAENIRHDVFLAGSHNKLNNVSDSIVMGNKNTITGVSNVISFGHQNTISADNAVAIGNGAGVSVEGGVALGVGSVASTAAGALGYGAAEGETGIAWKATNGAVSVGSSVEGKKITRQITNVAAGTADTDAVNVSQLKKVSDTANAGWNLSTNGVGPKATNVKPGEYVDFSGDKNISVSHDGTKVQVKLNKNIDVNYVQTNALNSKYSLSVGTMAENGIMPFLVSSTGAFYAANNNFSVDKDGKVIATAGEIGNVVLQNGVYTGKSALRDGELYVGDASGNYSQITTTGAKLGQVTIAADDKISGVAAGEVSSTSTDAINGSQLHAVATEAGKHTTLSNGKNTTVESTVKDGQTDYKVNVAGDLTDITSVANGDSKINLNKDSIIISNGNKYFAITNSGIGMSYIGADYSAKSIMLGENGTTISGGLNVAGSKITGVAEGEVSSTSTDAVNGSQLHAVATEAGKHSKVVSGNNINVEETDVDGQKFYKVNMNKDIILGDLSGKYVNISGTNGTIETTGYIATQDRVYADKGGKLADIDVTGNKISNGASSIVLDGSNVKVNDKVTIDQNGKISGVAAGEVSKTSTDAINGSQLNQTNENVAALDKRVTQNEADIAQNKADIAQNKADIAQNKADIAQNKADIATNKQNIDKLNTRVDGVEKLAKQHTTVTAGDNIAVTETTNKDGGKEYNVALKNKIDLGDKGSVTTGQTEMNNDGLKVGDKVSVTATAVTAGKTSISDEGVKVGDKTYINDKGLNANGQNITNVADGKVEKDSKDAINGGQLHQAKADINNRIDGVENQVVNNTNRINKLGSRVNKVGAGAAALAALHPMDFDPDDKLTFSAGYGNYGGENAAAIGAYYRPDEKVMFSVAGTVGNGENMVNAGVSFALDRTNHVSNSRTALAREVIDLRGQLAVMGAKMAKMEKAFGMLDETKTKLFPDVPANHWAYEYIAKLAGNGYIEGYPDGNFGGDRLMTRYEFAAMLYRAIEKGAALEEKIIKEFEPELGRIRVDRISGEDGDRDKIERVRVNDTKGERDHYGNKLAK